MTDRTDINASETDRGIVEWTTREFNANVNINAWDAFVNEFGKISRRMEKKGYPAPTYTVTGDDFLKSGVRVDDRGVEVEARWFVRPVTIFSPSLKMAGGFKVVGVMRTVSEDANGKPMNIVTANPEFEGDIDAFRDHTMHCDHCGFNRRRKEVVILESEEQGYVQVGKTCLKDFLGVDPALLFNKDVLLPEEWIEAHSGVGSSEDMLMDLEDLCVATAVERTKRPFISREQASDTDEWSTIDSTRRAYWDMHRTDKYRVEATEEEREIGKRIAAAMIKRAEDVAVNPVKATEFTFKVAALVRQGGAIYKHAGILVAGASKTYDWLNRDRTAPAKAQATKTSGFFGEVGKRDTFTLEFDKKVLLRDSHYGTTYVIKGNFNGSAFVWFAKDNKFVQDFVEGETCDAGRMTVKATVKSHKSHPRYGDSTVLTRVTAL